MAIDEKPISVSLGGRDWLRIPYGRESEPQTDVHEVCPDCGAKVGELHVTGFDVEQCPACGLQLLGCRMLERHEATGSIDWSGHPWAGHPFGPPSGS